MLPWMTFCSGLKYWISGAKIKITATNPKSQLCKKAPSLESYLLKWSEKKGSYWTPSSIKRQILPDSLVFYKGICYRTPRCLFNINVKRKRFSWEIHTLRKLFLGIKLISHLMSWLVATRSDPYQPLITNPFHPQTGYTFVANSLVPGLWIKPLDSHHITLYRRPMFLFPAFNMQNMCFERKKTPQN